VAELAEGSTYTGCLIAKGCRKIWHRRLISNLRGKKGLERKVAGELGGDQRTEETRKDQGRRKKISALREYRGRTGSAKDGGKSDLRDTVRKLSYRCPEKAGSVEKESDQNLLAERFLNI